MPRFENVGRVRPRTVARRNVQHAVGPELDVSAVVVRRGLEQGQEEFAAAGVGIATTERISATYPLTSIIMMSVQGEADYLRRSTHSLIRSNTSSGNPSRYHVSP